MEENNPESSKKILMALLVVYEDVAEVLQYCYPCVSEIPLFTGTIMRRKAQNLINQYLDKNRGQHRSIAISRKKHQSRHSRVLYDLVARRMIRCFSSCQSIG